MGTLQEDVCTFMTMTRSILLRMRAVTDNGCGENHNIQFTFKNYFENLWPLRLYYICPHYLINSTIMKQNIELSRLIHIDMAVKTQLYLCNIQGVSVCTNVSANYVFRLLLVRPSSGWT